MNKEPLADRWVPIPVMAPTQDPRSKGRPAADFPHFWGGAKVFSRRAMQGLWDLLAPHGEFLPLATDHGEYFAYNHLTRITGAVDENRSIPNLDHLRMNKYGRLVLRPENLLGQNAFVLTDERSAIFVTDLVADRISQLGLTGS